jgi:hypothetical protein
MVGVNVAANQQVFSDVLNDEEVWSFSLAGDTTTHQGVSFFDVRILVCVRSVLHNVHLVCVPFYDRHAAKEAKEAVYEVLCVWRPPHQMDLVIQDATVQISDELFAKTTHSFTVHLHQQGNLQLEMGSKCPKDPNRWAHFQGQLRWLLTHRVRLMQWVVDRQPRRHRSRTGSSPPPSTRWPRCAT